MPAAPPANDVTPPGSNTTAIRVEEIRSIAKDVEVREAEARKAARLHAVAIRLESSSADEPARALKRMFPHLARQTPIEIAVRVVFFLGYVVIAFWSVCLRAAKQVPRLAVKSRDGLRNAWMRAAFRA